MPVLAAPLADGATRVKLDFISRQGESAFRGDAMANMIHRQIRNVFVCVHSEECPTDVEWNAFLGDCRAVPPSELRVVAFTDGGRPNTVQRTDFAAYCGEAQPLIAVVSGNRIVRGAVTAISWFNKRIKLFSPAAANEALSHVGLNPVEAAQILKLAHQLSAEIDGGIPKAIASAVARR
jgi:hypothetical protein